MANLQKIENLLLQKGISYKVIDLGGQAFTVDHVAAIIGNVQEIVKTLLIKIPSRGGWEFRALCLRGADRVDFKKLKTLVGNKSEFASPAEVQKVVGVPVGAVCPVGIGVPVIVDKEVLTLNRVNLGSGDLTKGLEMDLESFLKVVEYKVEDLRKND